MNSFLQTHSADPRLLSHNTTQSLRLSTLTKSVARHTLGLQQTSHKRHSTSTLSPLQLPNFLLTTDATKFFTMSDTKPTQPAAPEGFTEREQRLMMFVLLHSDITSLSIDYPAVAARMGLTNVRSASNAWGALKKKILAIDAKDKAANPEKAAAAAEESAVTTSKAAAKTPAKGKRSAAAMTEGDADGDADAVETPTPTKKARGRKPKAAATPKAEGGEDAPIDLVTPTPKKAPRGRAAAKAKAEAAEAAAAKAAAVANEEEDDSESEVKKEAADVTMTEAKFTPVKSDDEDVEELINPDDVAELEKMAAAGVKAIKEEDEDDDGTI